MMGPILFLCLINDISDKLHGFQHQAIYADDILLYYLYIMVVEDDTDAEDIQNDLTSLIPEPQTVRVV